jgi:PleD family two-component response regulator
MTVVEVGSAESTVAKGDQVLLLPDTVRTFDRTSVPVLSRSARWEEGWDYRVARILIVEDEPDIRFMMRLILERAGYEVTDARHGVAGLTSVKDRQPDLVRLG